MNMSLIDWSVIFGLLTFLFVVLFKIKKYTKTASSFLVADRCAGRYLLAMAQGAIGLGAITVIAQWQMSFTSGFGAGWWSYAGIPIFTIITLSGWVFYRYRETRVMTIGQFFEMRYSKNFRIFAASIMWISGILNFGIFPAVGANFFVSYCGLSETYGIGPIVLGTYESIVFLLVIIPFLFAFWGGQIAVLVTDFLQSFFGNVVLAIVLPILLFKFPLKEIFDGLLIADPGKSMVNPFHAGAVDFSPWYFFIGLFGYIFNILAWQGTQGCNSSATSPHEAKMAGAIGWVRCYGTGPTIALIPLIAYMIMHHPSYGDKAAKVNLMLNGIENDQIRNQMITPLTMTLYMPIGLLGAYAAVMLAGTISGNSSYMHSWGSIFIQDIIIPIRKKPLTEKQHISLLRFSMLGVAAFIFLFSCLFRQTTHILLFFALTAAIWLGGAGAVITGGLYTRWGNTLAAYGAIISGSLIATTGLIMEQIWKSKFNTNLFAPTQYIYILVICLTAIATIIACRAIWLGGKRKICKVGIFASIAIIASGILIIEKSGASWILSKAVWSDDHFKLDGQWIFFFAMVISAEVYMLFSFFGSRTTFNLEKMLHRGEYQIKEDHVADEPAIAPTWNWKQLFGFTKEFTFGDKLIYGLMVSHSFVLFSLFVVVTAIALLFSFSDRNWANYHRYFTSAYLFASFAILVWVSVGGLKDLARLFKNLKKIKHDVNDDGIVRDHNYIKASESQDDQSQSEQGAKLAKEKRVAQGSGD